MTAQPVQHPMARVAPKLSEISDAVLFGDVWTRPQLSPRERSLITVAALLALNRSEQLQFHFSKALSNGLSAVELGELVTHLAFYAGWPCAASACKVLEDAVLAQGN